MTSDHPDLVSPPDHDCPGVPVCNTCATRERLTRPVDPSWKRPDPRPSCAEGEVAEKTP